MNVKGRYVIRFRQNGEADTELADKAADDLMKERVAGITLPERLLLELGYFLATNRHLDVENGTLCSGSRDSDGDVPSVDWSPDCREVCVGWYGPYDRYDSLCARAVVF